MLLEPVGYDSVTGHLILKEVGRGGVLKHHVDPSKLIPFVRHPSQRQRQKCKHKYLELMPVGAAYKAGWRTVCKCCGQKGR